MTFLIFLNLSGDPSIDDLGDRFHRGGDAWIDMPKSLDRHAEESGGKGDVADGWWVVSRLGIH